MLIDEIEQRLIVLEDEVKANMISNGVNASGRTMASLHIVRNDTFVALAIGNSGNNTAELTTLEKGVSPEKAAMEHDATTLYHIMQEWSEQKGLTFANIRERNTFAYFTSRKILREGTQRYKTNINIYSQERERAMADIKQIARNYVNEKITFNNN